MKKLLQQHNCKTLDDYTLQIKDNYLNGNRKDAKAMFLAMPRTERIDFLKNCIYYWNVEPSEHIFYFNAMFSL